MTTETMPRTPFTGAFVLLGAASAALVVGLLVTLAAALVAGSAAAYGALAGTLLVVAVFSFGAFVVNAVASLLPAAALLVALLTYTLQVLLMGLVFWAMSSSPEVWATLDRRWLAGAAIATTLGWLVAQTVLTLRQRIPVYDLALPAPVSALTGGER